VIIKYKSNIKIEHIIFGTEKVFLFVNLTKFLTMRSVTTPQTWSGLLFTKLQLRIHVSFSSSALSREWIRLAMEEKGKNKEFCIKTHNVAANS
jgi:hypothetical protein